MFYFGVGLIILTVVAIIYCFIVTIPELKKPIEFNHNNPDSLNIEYEKPVRTKNKKTKYSLIPIVAIVIAALFIGIVQLDDSKISLSEFNSIQNGMSYEQVCEIVGGPGELLSDVDIGIGTQYAGQVYMWEGNGSIGANANVVFQGGVVVSKAQFGLK